MAKRAIWEEHHGQVVAYLSNSKNLIFRKNLKIAVIVKWYLSNDREEILQFLY